MPNYRVDFTLTHNASIVIEAANEEEAIEHALDNWNEAKWDFESAEDAKANLTTDEADITQADLEG